uniref:Uncharacterized protein n=1 Tax=Aegilops tauschii subsp. strangulata TaxID=200361 RepID=A0A453JK66_AEGTS
AVRGVLLRFQPDPLPIERRPLLALLRRRPEPPLSPCRGAYPSPSSDLLLLRLLPLSSLDEHQPKLQQGSRLNQDKVHMYTIFRATLHSSSKGYIIHGGYGELMSRIVVLRIAQLH